MRILARVTEVILRSMRAKPAVPLQAYQVEVDILTHAARSRDKPVDDIDATSCVIGRQQQPSKQLDETINDQINDPM
jgi:hypothetical protein